LAGKADGGKNKILTRFPLDDRRPLPQLWVMQIFWNSFRWVPYRSLMLVASMAALLGRSAAAEQDYAKVEIKTTKVAGNIYMLQGAGGNIAASVGEDGIVMVDDQFAPLAGKIKAALQKISDQPIRFLINTHFHGDHTGGNAEFSRQTTILAHDNVRKRLQSGGTVLGGAVAASPREALPIITFSRDATIHFNGEDIQAIHLPNGHTDGDSVIYFHNAKVIHMGDDFVTYGFPFIDVENGGSVSGMIRGLEKVLEKVPAEVKVIPGHGGVSSVDDVRKYIAMLKDTRAIVAEGLKAGKTLEQIKSEKPLEKYADLSKGMIKPDKWIDTLNADLHGSAQK
jgi:glyoxylase-like metal-dependent hydrolase (beta-lactamase superfamily II)